MDLELTDRTHTPPAAATRYTSTTSRDRSMNPLLPPPPPPPPVYTRMAAPPAPLPSQLSSITAAKTLDELADEFLSGTQANQPQSVELVPTALSLVTTTVVSPVLAPDPLPADASDLERLQILVSRRAWSDVLLYTSQFKHGNNSHYAPLYRTIVGQAPSVPTDLSLETHQQELAFILHVNIEALVKLGLFKELSQEIKHWIFCHHHHNSKQNNAIKSDTEPPMPSWIPWSLHIAAAATLQFGDGSSTVEVGTGGAAAASPSQQGCLDALWAIRSEISSDDMNARMQVENALHNVFLSIKDWRMSLSCLQRMIEVAPALASAVTARLSQPTTEPSLSRSLVAAWKTELLSRQGRILLQAGALDQASILFQQSRLEWKNHGDPVEETTDDDATFRLYEAVRNIPAQLLVNDGLLKFSYGKHDEALESFHSAIQHLRRAASSHRDKSCTTLVSSSDNVPVLLGGHSSTIYSETINNMALCALYTCRLPQALYLLESLIREDVTNHLTERVALNLCTLYELASDTAASARRKRVLQLIARRFHLHDIKPESFRVS